MAASSLTALSTPLAGSLNISTWWPRYPLIIGEFLSNTRANLSNRFHSPSLEKSSSPSAEGQSVCDVLTVLIIKNQFAMLLRLPTYLLNPTHKMVNFV